MQEYRAKTIENVSLSKHLETTLRPCLLYED